MPAIRNCRLLGSQELHEGQNKNLSQIIFSLVVSLWFYLPFPLIVFIMCLIHKRAQRGSAEKRSKDGLDTIRYFASKFNANISMIISFRLNPLNLSKKGKNLSTTNLIFWHE
jgi:hypothetical protein